MTDISTSKSEAILKARCKSQFILFLLYLLGIWEFQKAENFSGFWNTFVVTEPKIVYDYSQLLAQNENVFKDTLSFVEIIKNYILDLDKEYVSYDAKSLFTSIPIGENIDYTIKQIYENKVIKPMSKSR